LGLSRRYSTDLFQVNGRSKPKTFLLEPANVDKTRPYYSFVQLSRCTDRHTVILHRRMSSVAICVSNIMSKVYGVGGMQRPPQTETKKKIHFIDWFISNFFNNSDKAIFIYSVSIYKMCTV